MGRSIGELSTSTRKKKNFSLLASTRSFRSLRPEKAGISYVNTSLKVEIPLPLGKPDASPEPPRQRQPSKPLRPNGSNSAKPFGYRIMATDYSTASSTMYSLG
jgi:hypothetical protein